MFCFLIYADKIRISARKSINEKIYLTVRDNRIRYLFAGEKYALNITDSLSK